MAPRPRTKHAMNTDTAKHAIRAPYKAAWDSQGVPCTPWSSRMEWSGYIHPCSSSTKGNVCNGNVHHRYTHNATRAVTPTAVLGSGWDITDATLSPKQIQPAMPTTMNSNAVEYMDTAVMDAVWWRSDSFMEH